MKVLTDILTILNLCSVQFYGLFDSETSLQQSHVPTIILEKNFHAVSQKTTGTLKSIQSASLSQKCLQSGTGIVAFISVNDGVSIEIPQDALINELKLNRYQPLLDQISSHSNPAFVLLQINRKVTRYNFIFDWMKLPITSQLYLFDTENIYHPMIDAGPNYRIALNNHHIRSETSALKAKLDLKGRYISLKAGFPSSRKISDCSLNRDKLLTHPELCIIHFLEKQINFTTIPPRQKPRYFLLKLFNFVANNYINNIVITKGIPGLQWLSHGVNFQPFKLILITKLQKVNVDALLQPFDRYIWMALLAANCLFFTTVCFGTHFKKKLELILWMISTILYQTDEVLTRYLFHAERWINFFLLSSWFLPMVLLGVMYQGDLYSCLSCVRLSHVPNTLRETLLTNIPLFTIGESCYDSETAGHNNRECFSTLLDVLIPDILKITEPHDILRQRALQVHNRTKHVHGTSISTAAEMAFLIEKEQVRQIQWDPPNTLGILASSNEIDEFTTAAKSYFNKYIIQETIGGLNPFITRTPWITQQGWFAKAFSSGLASLSQSGLIEMWSKNNLNGKVRMHTIKTEFESMDALENNFFGKDLTERHVQSRLNNGPSNSESSGRRHSKFYLVQHETTFVFIQSIPLEVMKLPFAACLVMISVSVCVFLAECVANHITKVTKLAIVLKAKETRQAVNEVLKVSQKFLIHSIRLLKRNLMSKNTKLQYLK
jgi:hypothetical protein